MSTDEPTIRGHEILDKILSRALADDEFRQRLFANPKRVLADEGLTVPSELEVVVHQNTSDTVHLVLPTAPISEQRLNVDETNVRPLSNHLHF